jgi:hypothetical protein
MGPLATLKLAGVTRPQLFEHNQTRIALRAHDLRAGFVTVSLANGKTERWVTDRTGHRSSQMLSLYRKQARSHAELNLEPYAPLDARFRSWLTRLRQLEGRPQLLTLGAETICLGAWFGCLGSRRNRL